MYQKSSFFVIFVQHCCSFSRHYILFTRLLNNWPAPKKCQESKAIDGQHTTIIKTLVTTSAVMGSNKGLKIYQITNNFVLFYQIIQTIQIIFYKVNFSYLFSVHYIFSPISAQRQTRPILNVTKKQKKCISKLS
jgi:hypothetical protein